MMNSDIFIRFLKMHGINFRVVHSDSSEEIFKGLVNVERGRDIVQFMPDSDIKIGDKLINPANEVLYVLDKKTEFINGKPISVTAYTQSQAEHDNTMSITFQLQQIRDTISSKNSADSEQLSQIVGILSDIYSSKKPINQGILSKFSSAMERNSWITSPIASVLLSMLLQK